MILLIKDNQKHFNRLHIVVDALVIAVAFLSAWFIRFKSGIIPLVPGGVLETSKYFSLLFVIVPLFIVLNAIFQLYTPKRATGRKIEIFNILKANTAGLVTLVGGLYILNHMNYSRVTFVLFYILCVLLEMLSRTFIRNVLRAIRKKGFNVKYVLLVGYSRAAEEYINRIRTNPQWGYVIRGILDDTIEAGTEYKGIKVLGRIDNLNIILPDNKLDEIAITLALREYGRLEEIVGLCEKSGVHTKFIPDYNSVIPSRPYTEDLQGLPVINIRHVPLTNTMNAAAKRVADIFLTSMALVIASPIMLLCTVIIKCTSRGPIIYKQQRVGMHNRSFWMYKFRSMQEQTIEEEKNGWTTKDDPRVTSFGKFMRKTSLDELPQLFNIFMGKMSIVGPRPERPQYVEKFKEEIPRYMIKHQVRPGLTGWAQVNGYRGDTSIQKRIEYDLFYIENWTMSFDFRIMFLTIFKGFINKNAY